MSPGGAGSPSWAVTGPQSVRMACGGVKAAASIRARPGGAWMILNLLLLLVPVSLVLAYVVHASPVWVFATAILAIIPLAEWVRRGTEQMARLAGPAIGGLLNVTFGNVSELILALFVLSAGNVAVAKAQITGSIIGNSLLGLGLAIVVGRWGRTRRTF